MRFDPYYDPDLTTTLHSLGVQKKVPPLHFLGSAVDRYDVLWLVI